MTTLSIDETARLTQEVERLKARLAREREARLEAEIIAENSLRSLYQRQCQIGLLRAAAVAAYEASTADEAIRATLEQVCLYAGWPVGHALPCDGGRAGLRSTALWHPAAPDRAAEFRRRSEAAAFAPGRGLPGRAWQSGQAAWAERLSDDPWEAAHRVCADGEVVFGCAVPVHEGAAVSLILEFFSDRAVPEDAALQEVLADVAQQLGRALERRRQEETLRQAEQRFRAIFENAVEGFFQTTPEGRYLSANPALARLYGYDTPEELIAGLSDIQTMLYTDPGRRAEFQERLEREGRITGFESQVRRRDGELIWVSENARLVRDAQGQPLYYEGTVEDVTQRRAAQTALRESEAKFHRIVANLPGVVYRFVLRPDGSMEFPFVSEACQDIYGFDAAAAQQDPSLLLDCVFEEDRDDFRASILESARTLQPWNWDRRMRRPDGKDLWIQAISRPHRRENGEVVWDGVLMNVADRMAAAEQLRASTEMLQLVMNSVPQMIFWKDTQSVYAGCNENFARVAGVSDPSEIAGKTDYDMPWTRAEAETYRRMDRWVMDGDSPKYRVIETQHQADGSEIWAETNKIPLHNSDGEVVGILGTYEDITDRIAAERRIRALNAELEERIERIVLLNDDLAQAYETTIEGWARALDLRDRETEGHSRRVTEMTVRLAEKFGFTDEEIVHIRRGALLHDIGKMGVPDAVLLKPGRLTLEEREIIERHPDLAREMLLPIEFLRPALDIPYCHHERWDGAGYPRRLAGEAIPLAARLFAIVDVCDALRSDRPYRAAWPIDRVIAHLRESSGTHFDPAVVRAFLEILEVERPAADALPLAA